MRQGHTSQVQGHGEIPQVAETMLRHEGSIVFVRVLGEDVRSSVTLADLRQGRNM